MRMRVGSFLAAAIPSNIVIDAVQSAEERRSRRNFFFAIDLQGTTDLKPKDQNNEHFKTGGRRLVPSRRFISRNFYDCKRPALPSTRRRALRPALRPTQRQISQP
jgi:hypothetical protein